MHKKLMIVAIVILSACLCAATFPDEPKFKNLKVLSKKITHDEMDSVMQHFKVSLGVKCSFCHAPRKDDPKKLDFASDDNDHKLIARDMMRMTSRINRKYFGNENGANITCFTCHQGNKEPKAAPKFKREE